MTIIDSAAWTGRTPTAPKPPRRSTGLRGFVEEQESIDLDLLSRGELMAMAYRLNDKIQAQFLPALGPFFRLCRLHHDITTRIADMPVEYSPRWLHQQPWDRPVT